MESAFERKNVKDITMHIFHFYQLSVLFLISKADFTKALTRVLNAVSFGHERSLITRPSFR